MRGTLQSQPLAAQILVDVNSLSMKPVQWRIVLVALAAAVVVKAATAVAAAVDIVAVAAVVAIVAVTKTADLVRITAKSYQPSLFL
jgi:hypothetical protein